ncbi:tripartite motif-containing protein 2-like isoform X1 [Biomphalaria glabrata]|uniref:Tripartite motif-containing protein 2-like isoform X1 n=1 Tax=Biomphalaria glabrata TaxID=6526 RepID=A0A9U8DVB5_BIOGL|nr:tripartite motif-containing protein 2-like isoform X1 [Biomphalaria glabrata]
MSCYSYGLRRIFGVTYTGRRLILLNGIENTISSDTHTTYDLNSTVSAQEDTSQQSQEDNWEVRTGGDFISGSISNVEVTAEQNQTSSASLTTSGNTDPLGVDTELSQDNPNYVEIETTITTTSNPDPHSSHQNNREVAEDRNMSEENLRLEEKLRQFQNDVKKDENDDTKGTYNTMQLSESEKQRRRNLIFDEERFEETFLKCLICREIYNEYDKLPKMLHCHHTFCMDCLYQMYRVEGEFRQSLTGVFRAMPMTVKIHCPTCREGILISEPELKRLPNDHTIMELLCFVSQTNKNEVQYCTKHQMQPLNFFCEPCIMPVCCDCTVIDHKESKGHVVVNVDEAMNKYAPIVDETLDDIRSERAILAEKREALEGAQDDIDQIQRDLTSQIRKVFDGIREVLDERERELYDVADTEIDRKREILDGHMRILLERDAELNSGFTELQHAKEDKDISLIFTGQKSARDVLSRQVDIPLNSTKGFSVTFQFSGRTENVIKQQIVNLGDIIFHS